MSRLAVIASLNFFNKDLVEGLLDVYLYDDPDLSIVTYNHARYGVEAWVSIWAGYHGIDVDYHDRGWDRVGQFKDEVQIQCDMDMICDSDEALIFWDGKDETVEPTFDICRGQEKSQLIVISNDEEPCAIYTEW